MLHIVQESNPVNLPVPVRASQSTSGFSKSLSMSASKKGVTGSSLNASVSKSRSGGLHGLMGVDMDQSIDIVSPSLPTNNLELSLLKLVTMWNIVEEDITQVHIHAEKHQSSIDKGEDILVPAEELTVSIRCTVD
mgnify:CR=1 FL=1